MDEKQYPEQQQVPCYEEDEIDLVELLGVLVRRWRWILGTAVLAVLLALGYGLLQTPSYSYHAIVQIGQCQFIQPPQAAAETLKTSARTVLSKWKDQDKISSGLSAGDIEVSPAIKSGILEISLNAPKDSNANSFLKEIISNWNDNHERVLETASQDFEQKITTLEADIEGLKEKKLSYLRQLESIKGTKTYLKNQIEQATARIDELMSAKAKANLNTSEPNALMLFTSEIQRKEEYIDGLRSQLLTEIPREKEHIKTRLIECKSNIHSKEASKKYQQVALKNMEKTRTLLGSTRSDHPVEPNIKLIVALGLVTGVFLGIFMAFIREFWANNRDRILNKE